MPLGGSKIQFLGDRATQVAETAQRLTVKDKEGVPTFQDVRWTVRGRWVEGAGPPTLPFEWQATA